MTLNDDFSKAYITLTAATAFISTDNEQSDEHLRNGDFFDAANFPELKFISKAILKVTEDTFTLHGDLSMKIPAVSALAKK